MGKAHKLGYPVNVLNEGAEEYYINFATDYDKPKTPTINRFTEEWRDTKGRPFPPEDLTPKRIGMISHQPHRVLGVKTYVFNCIGISWAHATLMDNDAIRAELPQSEVFPVIGVGCAIYTRDGKLVITRRAGPDKVKQCPNKLHVVGGYVDLQSSLHKKSLLPTVYNELEEEAGIYPHHITTIIPIGAYENTLPGLSGIHVGFFARVSLTADEVLTRTKSAKDSYEGAFLKYSPAEVRELLNDHSDDFVPGAAASLSRILDTKPWENPSCAKCHHMILHPGPRHELFIVRHKQTDWNLLNISVGSINMALNGTGIEQAREHGEKLKTEEVLLEEIITSPLARAHETAQIIADILGIGEPTIDTRLRERCVGIQEGKTDIKDWWKYFDPGFAPDGAEPYAEFQQRVADAFTDIAHRQKNRLVITHALVLIEFALKNTGLTVSNLPCYAIPGHTETLRFFSGNKYTFCNRCGNRWFNQP